MLGFIVAFYYFIRLRQFQDPSGADGYFYLKQIQSLSESGQFYYKDYSFGFFPATFINFFLHDPLLSYQISASLCFGLIFLFSSRISQKLSGSEGFNFYRACSLLMGAAIVFQNPAFIELNFVFMKSAMAILFLLVAIDMFLGARHKSAIGFLIAAALSHKVMLLFVPIGFLVFCFIKLRTENANFKFSYLEERWQKLFFAFATIGILLLLGNLLKNHIGHLFARIDLSKFSLLTFENYPQYSFFILFYGICSIVLFMSSSNFKGDFFKRSTVIFLSLILLLPFVFPDALNTNSVSFRFLLVASPVCLIAISYFIQKKKSLRIIGFVFAGAIVFLNHQYSRPFSTWIAPWTARIQNVDEIAKSIPEGSLLYAPHGLEFYLAYKTPFRPRSFIVNSKGRDTYRIAYIRPYTTRESLLKNDLSLMAVKQLGPEFSIFHETDWILLNDIHLLRPHVMNLLEKLPDFIADYD